MNTISDFKRRDFLKGIGAATGTLALLMETESARGFLANDTIHVACIGTGGRCRHLMKSLSQATNVKIAAVCDVWDESLRLGKELADPSAATSKDFRAILDRKDIDAVLIGTPDHWHVPITVAACQAGKDVYVEKPLTHDLSEGKLVLNAQKESARVVQVGTQQRSMPHIQKAREILKSGVLGEVFKTHLSWNRNAARSDARAEVDPKSVDWKAFLGNAKDQPFDPYRFRQWRWFWDFGGGIFTDLMVHWIDVAHWLLDLSTPNHAVSVGEWNMAEGLWETPDTVQTLLQYPNKTQAHFEGTFSNARLGAMIEFMGTEATLYIDRGRYEVIPERKKKVEASEWVLGSGPRGADFYDKPDGEFLHLTNWLECIRSRHTPNAPVEAGVHAAAAAHLANLALRSKQAATLE